MEAKERDDAEYLKDLRQSAGFNIAQLAVMANLSAGQMRQLEFLADEEGDWSIHCHKSHHTMNAMGHNVPTMIGVDHREVGEKISKLISDYMVMGDKGMHDHAVSQTGVFDRAVAAIVRVAPEP